MNPGWQNALCGRLPSTDKRFQLLMVHLQHLQAHLQTRLFIFLLISSLLLQRWVAMVRI